MSDTCFCLFNAHPQHPPVIVLDSVQPLVQAMPAYHGIASVRPTVQRGDDTGKEIARAEQAISLYEGLRDKLRESAPFLPKDFNPLN